MDRYGRAFNVQLLVANSIAVVLTVLFTPPGAYVVETVLASIDCFFVFVLLFGSLTCWSEIDLWNSSTAADSST